MEEQKFIQSKPGNQATRNLNILKQVKILQAAGSEGFNVSYKLNLNPENAVHKLYIDSQLPIDFVVL